MGRHEGGLSRHGELNRHDYDVSWTLALPVGVVVGSVLRVELDIEAVLGGLPEM